MDVSETERVRASVSTHLKGLWQVTLGVPAAKTGKKTTLFGRWEKSDFLSGSLPSGRKSLPSGSMYYNMSRVYATEYLFYIQGNVS